MTAATELLPADLEVLSDPGVTSKGQGYGLDRIYRWGPHKLRVQINRNAFDTQSSYVVSTWRDGWVEVGSFPREHPDAAAMPPYVAWMPDAENERYRARTAECRLAVEVMAARLLTIAAVVLG